MAETVPIITPKGTLLYAYISGQGKKKYNTNDEYEYSIVIRLAGEDAQKVIEQIKEVAATMPKGCGLKSLGYRPVVKDAEGNLRAATKTNPKKEDEVDTDMFDFNFHTQTHFKNGKVNEISVFNSGKKTGKPQKINLGDKRIGNGSIGLISGKLCGSTFGKEFSVSLYLTAVQLTKFVEYQGTAGFEQQQDDDFDETDGLEGIEEDSGFSTQTETTETEKPKL